MTDKMTDSQMVSHLRTHAHWTREQPWTDIADRLEKLSQNSLTEKEHKQFELLKKAFQHLYPEKTDLYFICGESGEKDSVGLPEHILVCPTYGSDGVAMYTMSKPYSAPGW